MCAEQIFSPGLKTENFARFNAGLLITAEREMVSFVAAVNELFGSGAGQLAAEYWMDELGEVDWSLNEVAPNWRQISIAAAARMSHAPDIDPSLFAGISRKGHSPPDKTKLRPKVSDTNVIPFESSHRRQAASGGSASSLKPIMKWKVDRWPDPSWEIPVRHRLFDDTQGELQRMDIDFLELEPLAMTGRMAHCISHDLRNLLCAVCSSAELMSESKTSQSDREKWLDEVRLATRDMTDMLDGLLLFAETGKTLNPQPAFLDALVEHAVTMVRMHPDARNVELIIEELPTIECWIDDKKLGGAVYNLLLNACQAAKRGRLPRRVAVALFEDQNLIQIRVSDTGPGVPDSIRNTLYKPFVSAGKQNGIGLGLTIAERTAREHGGFVHLEESMPGNTVFVLYLSKLALVELAEAQMSGLTQA